MTLIYQFLVSYGCLGYADHGNSNSFEGLIIVYYYLPLIFALPVFVLMDWLVIYGGEGIKYLPQPDKVLKRYFAYFWSQISLFVPVIVILFIGNTRQSLVDSREAYRIVAISTIITILISIITLFVKVKDTKKVQALLKHFDTIFFVLMAVEILAWVFCSLMNGLA